MKKLNIAGMSRDELIQVVVDQKDTLDIDILKQALDRIDALDCKEKTAAESAIETINNEAFDDLPLEEQLKKLMRAAQSLSDDAKKYGIDI